MSDAAYAPGRKYAPTVGMLRALSGAPGATPLDYTRCRLRGLIDGRDLPTSAGRLVINREIHRQKELGRG